MDVGELLAALPDVATSAGSACASINAGPSHVLKAMGVADGVSASVRFSFGRFNTLDEVERAAKLVVRAAGKLGVPVTHSP